MRNEEIELCCVPDGGGGVLIASMGCIPNDWPEVGRTIVQVLTLPAGTIAFEYISEEETDFWPTRGAGRPRLKWIDPLEASTPGFLVLSTPPTKRNRLIGYSVSSGESVWSEADDPMVRFSSASMTAGADIDGDGACDLWVGDVDIGSSGRGFEPGLVRVLSGRTGKLLLGIRGMDADASHGIALASYPDQDGDGIEEVLVTDAWPLFCSRLLTLSGKDGSVLASLRFNQDFWRLGEFLEVGLDWDGKGLPDLVVTNYLPEGGTQHGTHVIGIVSMEDARLLHYITPELMASKISERNSARQRR